MPTGENFQQTMPTIKIQGSRSGDVTVTGTDSLFNYVTNNSSLTKISQHAAKYDEAIFTIRGTATVTITAPANTQVHYTLTGKNPTYKAITADGSITPLKGSTYKYVSAFTLTQARPAKNQPCVIKLRSYGLSGSTVKPNDHSKTLVVRFFLIP